MLGDVVDEVFAECLDGLLVDFSLFQALLAEVVGLLWFMGYWFGPPGVEFILGV